MNFLKLFAMGVDKIESIPDHNGRLTLIFTKKDKHFQISLTPKYYGRFRDAVIRGDIPVCKEISMETMTEVLTFIGESEAFESILSERVIHELSD